VIFHSLFLAQQLEIDPELSVTFHCVLHICGTVCAFSCCVWRICAYALMRINMECGFVWIDVVVPRIWSRRYSVQAVEREKWTA